MKYSGRGFNVHLSCFPNCHDQQLYQSKNKTNSATILFNYIALRHYEPAAIGTGYQKQIQRLARNKYWFLDCFMMYFKMHGDYHQQ